jgi:hypothetical protein
MESVLLVLKYQRPFKGLLTCGNPNSWVQNDAGKSAPHILNYLLLVSFKASQGGVAKERRGGKMAANSEFNRPLSSHTVCACT